MHHIICGAQVPCGFRVGEDYYREKRRFMPGVCARCNGPVRIVTAYTENDAPGVEMDLRNGAIVNSPVSVTPPTP